MLCRKWAGEMSIKHSAVRLIYSPSAVHQSLRSLVKVHECGMGSVEVKKTSGVAPSWRSGKKKTGSAGNASISPFSPHVPQSNS
jgi:hypothetical protein